MTFADFGVKAIRFLLNHPVLVKLIAQGATGHKNKGVFHLNNCQKRIDLAGL
jgi:hypothetical protein